MKTFKTFFLLFFFGTFLSFAQLDDPTGNKNKGKIIGTLNAKAKVTEIKKPKSLNFGNDKGIKNANKALEKEISRKKKEKEFENKGILTPQMMAFNSAKKNLEGKFKHFPMIDMDLGSFHTKSKSIFISSYDFGRFDGDKVQISINGKRIHNNFLLTSRVKTIKIPLDKGINKIEVTAINEGELSPNTGYFAFFDEDQKVIKEDKWMLATGAKVIAIVVRDEK